MDVKDIKGARVTHAGLLKHNADGTTETQKITHAGLVARSPEGTAAKGMNIRGNEDLWVEIQANTFRNWVNEHLRSANMKVQNLSTDFCDGTCLCALVESLQTRSLKPSWNRCPANQHHYLENATTALNAIELDHIKLVNIGNVDIVNGNVKLILGLIWSLIVRYQIGRSKFPPRKLMLAWLQAALPECKINNLTTDWNSGVNLAALLDYCQPGLFPHWRSLDPTQSVRNCRTAMDIAQKEFGVPKVLEPEYLASPWLDELSGMTYLSYFMKPGGPGYNATISWVNSQIQQPVNNFTTSWNDGRVFCEIIRSLGGQAPSPEKLSADPSNFENNIRKAVEAGSKLGVLPILTPRDMANPEVEHLGIMAYAAHLQWVTPHPPLTDMISVYLESTSGRVGENTHYRVEILADDISLNQVTTFVIPPTGNAVPVRINAIGEGYFMAEKYGMHEIIVQVGDESIGGHFFRVLPRLVHVMPPGMAPCALGSLVEVLVNATGAPKTEDILVTAVSPTGKSHICSLKKVEEGHSAVFKPNEAGTWEIAIKYQGRHIQGGPFTCAVFDASGVTVHGLEGALPNRAHSFEVDARGVGVCGELQVDIVHDKHSLACAMEKLAENKYRVTFMPRKEGKYRIYIYFDAYDVKGSPFIMRVGTKGRSGKTRSSLTQEHKRTESPSMNLSSITPRQRLGRSQELRKSPSYLDHQQYQSPKYSPQFDRTDFSTNQKFEKLVSEIYNTRSELQTSRILEKNYTFQPTTIYSNTSTKQQFLNNSTEVLHNTGSPELRIDNSSNVRVSSKPTSARRDSWDVINKTKNILSHNSLESVAKMTESQLDTNLNFYDPETENEVDRNKQYKKLGLHHQLGHTGRHSSSESVGTDNCSKGITIKSEYDKNKYIRSGLNILSVSNEHNINEKTMTEKDTYSSLNSFTRTRPVTIKSSGAQAIRVENIPNGIIGRPVEFEIDGSNAGSGNLEILVNGGRVTSSVRSLGGQRFIASFTPHEPGIHTVQITFNDETVPGSPWHIEIMSSPGLTALGESTRLVPANTPAVFEILPPPGESLTKSDFEATVLTPNKIKLDPKVTQEAANGAVRIEFVPTQVGTHIIEASINGTKISGGPLIAKVYDSNLIQVTDVNNGVVGQPCQFRVDASAAGEGQLEISINEGEVPNHVQVVGGGRCLVSFTPEHPKTHLIDIKFNGETVHGCPFVCNIADTSRVSLKLSNLDLIPVNRPASFHIIVSGGDAAELAVSVRGPHRELPVRVTGDIHIGFSAEFTPTSVGNHTINVEYNGFPVHGTPFIAKVYDASKVVVGNVSRGTVGRPVQFIVDAGDAGEGNLEITITAKGQNIPTQVHPQGSARFSVSFLPTEACDHTIHVSFNKISVPGCPITVSITGGPSGPQVSFGGPGPVNLPNSFIINHNGGRLDDIEVNVEGPAGQSIPAQVHQTSEGVFKAEFVPRVVGEHHVNVSVNGLHTAGSPYTAKVYDVNSIKVKSISTGTVGKPVTFLVETSQAGPGNLEVTVNGGRVPTSAQAQGQHIYAISFTPREAQQHTVELRFNGQDVPGSPFICRIAAAARIQSLDCMDKINVGRPFEFIVESDTEPLVEVLGPARRKVAASVYPLSSCQAFNVKFEATEVGDHSVEVRLPGGGHVDGSPFLLKAYSAEKVIVTDIHPGVVGKSVTFGINASQAGAGNLEIIVAVNGKNVPNFVQSEGNAHFKVNFKPTEAATHLLSVRFNGHPVPGSPFACEVSASSNSLPQIIAHGSSLKQAAVNVKNTFELKGIENVQPQIAITSPCGENISCQTSNSEGISVISFRPLVVGRHLISITINDQHITGSPFSCNVFDVSRVTISGLNKKYGPAVLNVPVMFSVDAAGSGEGTLELVVSTETSTVKAEVVACARGLYDVTFIPRTTEIHYVNVTFNEVAVNGSPFHVEVKSVAERFQIGSLVSINVNEEELVEIFGPDNKLVPVTTTGQDVEFTTNLIGNYIIRFMENETHRHLGTRMLSVFDASLVKITEVGEALCHRPASISLSLKEAGHGHISVVVKCGPFEVPHSIRGPSKDDIYQITYHPTRLAPHKISIYFNDVPISRKPLEINVLPTNPGKEISVSGLGLYQARVGKTTSFAIDTLKRLAREFDVVVSGPEGQALPVRCYQTKSGHLQAEFIINNPGQCRIEVLHQSKPLQGSPFTCEAFDSNRVKVQELPKGPFALNVPISLSVCTTNAGIAELEAFAVSSSNQYSPLNLKEQTEGIHTIEFVPEQSGNYKLEVYYGGEPIPASPFVFGVLSSQEIRAVGDGLKICHRNRETSFMIYSSTSPNVQIERLNEFRERIEPKIMALSNNEWRIAYTILSVGRYEIRASCSKQGMLPGSPWIVSCVDASKVNPIGGWGTLLDNEGRLILPARIVFDVEHAGPGELVCTIDKKEVAVENVNDNQKRVYISAVALASGEHEFDLAWSGLTIMNCPRSAFVTGQQGADRVLLTGGGLTTAQAGEASHFTIDATNAPPGNPEVILVRPNNTSVPVCLAKPRPNENIWLASYTLQKPSSGSLNLSVKWNGLLIKGCPMIVSVVSSMDASKVVCSGEGLRQGIVGKDIKSWIDTRRAGPGELTAHCTGPRKVAYCELYDHGDATFTLNIKPQESGRHILTIKYGGLNVTGSPFTLKVAGAPDARKVRVYGPGIEHGVLATFQSRFICDTRGAGAGQLTVRVRGPKGAFRVEMQRESQKDRTILCKYDPTEPGDYRVEVKWADELVPGSPFPVMIFDTEEELCRYLQSI